MSTLPKDLKVTVLDNDLARADITVARNEQTETAQFRAAIRNLTGQLFVAASRRLMLNEVKVKTPVALATGHTLAVDVVIGIILRAGLWMLEPILQFLPGAPLACIGTRREEGAVPVSYLCSIPPVTDSTIAFLLDVMLATGGSACDAIMRLVEEGVDPRNIRLLCVFAAPEGVRRVNKEYPAVQIFAAQVDEKLNNVFFIVQGCGDAGDRLCGTPQAV